MCPVHHFGTAPLNVYNILIRFVLQELEPRRRKNVKRGTAPNRSVAFLICQNRTDSHFVFLTCDNRTEPHRRIFDI